MSLLLTMLPIYLLGNLHCLGMCGPLVALLGRHRYRMMYFAGRTTSFALAGLISGGIGAVVNGVLRTYQLAALASFLFGGCILLLGISTLLGLGITLPKSLSSRLQGFQKYASLLILRDTAWSTALFGFFTVFLPCGQTLIVFSACALEGNAAVGLLNGAAFAVLTSPSLWLAMHAQKWLGSWKKYERPLMGSLAIAVGILAICRGCAELELIPHLVLNPSADLAYHIVLF